MRMSPFVTGRTDFDELVERLWAGAPMSGARGTSFEVPTDVFHTDAGLVIRMDLPGINPDDVEVTMQENTLLINGRREFPWDGESVRFIRRGAFYGEFTQRVVLGKGLKTDEISARYEEGVLELRIPHAEEVQPRKIQIESSGRQTLSE